MQNLLDGRREYPTLKEARDDLHLMIRDPERFLFDVEDSATSGEEVTSGGDGVLGLRVRKGKLYGREKEVKMVTDAFCRVSSGKDAAFFVGGYSGESVLLSCSILRAVMIAPPQLRHISVCQLSHYLKLPVQGVVKQW